MDLSFWQSMVTIIGLPVATISVVALIYQNYQLTASLKSQVYQGLIDNSLKIDSLMIEYPTFRKYIYGSEPVNDKTSDLDKLMGVTEFMLDVIDNINAQQDFIPKKFRPGWKDFVETVLQSPAAQYFTRLHGSWYVSNYTREID